jgi:hypothetical protein
MRPPATLRETGVGVAPVQDLPHALQLLTHGQRAERRVARQWLVRHHAIKVEAVPCRKR